MSEHIVKDNSVQGPYSVAYEVWFKDKIHAEEYVANILMRFHPAGYGTFLRIDEEDNMFVVRGYRGMSCD